MKEFVLRFAEDRVMTAGLSRQLLRFAFRVDGKSKEMSLSRIRTASNDDGSVGVIHVDQLVELKVDRRDWAHERAIGRMQLCLPSAVAFGCPKKLPPVLQPNRHWFAIEIQPGGIGFAQQLTSRARRWIHCKKQLFLLQSVLDHDGKRRRVFFPNHARQIRILFAIPLDPTRLATGAPDNSQPHFCVPGSGARIEIFRGRGFRMKRVRDESRFHPAVIGLLVD